MKNLLKLSLVSLAIASFAITACGDKKEANEGSAPQAQASASQDKAAPSDKKSQVVIRLGHTSNKGEPFYAGVEKWKELVEQRSNGTIKIELYPSSQLGNKEDLLDQLVQGEPICTLADGAYFYDRGVKDFGIIFGPYLFDNWDQAYKLYRSNWYQEQSKKLEEKAGIKIVASNWRFGVRQTLSRKPIKSLEGFKGLKIRVPTNIIQLKGEEVLGATPTPMALSEVYTGLQQGTIDAVENPVALLYYGKFHEVAKYLLLDAHVYNITNLVVGKKFFDKLTPEQQKLLTDTCYEAGEYQNKLSEESDTALLKKMQEEGVTITTPDDAFKQQLVETSRKFYTLPDFKDWTPGLYETVKKEMQ